MHLASIKDPFYMETFKLLCMPRKLSKMIQCPDKSYLEIQDNEEISLLRYDYGLAIRMMGQEADCTSIKL